ncbi:MAG: CsbD family protein [Selenomonadaceae bacterium]
MNEDILQGKWAEIKGSIKVQWGKLTDDDLIEIQGMQEKLEGLLQTKYGYSKERVQQEYSKFINDYKKNNH